MTPFDELRILRTIGRIQYAWFVSTVQAVARAHGFPPPTGHPTWNDDAAVDWVNDLVAGSKGLEFLNRVGLTATDQASYDRLLRKSVKNALIDQAKATPVGKLRARMRTLLAAEPRVQDATHLLAGQNGWTLPENGEAVWAGDWDDLTRAPGLRAIGPIESLNTAGPTPAPQKKSLLDASVLMLADAAGAVLDQGLASALVKVFDLSDAPPLALFTADGDDPAASASTYRAELVARIEAPGQWLETIDEANLLQLEFSANDLDEIGHAVLHIEEAPTLAGQALFDRVRAAASRLGSSYEAVQIVFARCRNRAEGAS